MLPAKLTDQLKLLTNSFDIYPLDKWIMIILPQVKIHEKSFQPKQLYNIFTTLPLNKSLNLPTYSYEQIFNCINNK